MQKDSNGHPVSRRNLLKGLGLLGSGVAGSAIVRGLAGETRQAAAQVAVPAAAEPPVVATQFYLEAPPWVTGYIWYDPVESVWVETTHELLSDSLWLRGDGTYDKKATRQVAEVARDEWTGETVDSTVTTISLCLTPPLAKRKKRARRQYFTVGM